jgi:uncharacterized protein YecE (DUF72 family)
MRVLVGTSGYSYKEWKGSFYPAELADSDMLRYYSGRFRTVEINNTFYRLPGEKDVARWAEQTPPGFTFALKASRRITHDKRLSADSADTVAYLLRTAAGLGPKLGPLLFQLPPFLKKDAARLKSFLGFLPETQPAAFEFRHPSWFDQEVYEALRSRDAALCAADTDESGDEGATIVPTARWGYLRLRRADYGDADLARWADRIRAHPWERVFVFFKHEDEGKGPELAAGLMARLES